MQSPNSQSKPGSLVLPMASHSDSAATIYDWLKDTVEEVDYGEVGVSLTMHQGQIVRVQKTVTLSRVVK